MMLLCFRCNFPYLILRGVPLLKVEERFYIFLVNDFNDIAFFIAIVLSTFARGFSKLVPCWISIWVFFCCVSDMFSSFYDVDYEF
jgi:hypothetical protein